MPLNCMWLVMTGNRFIMWRIKCDICDIGDTRTFPWWSISCSIECSCLANFYSTSFHMLKTWETVFLLVVVVSELSYCWPKYLQILNISISAIIRQTYIHCHLSHLLLTLLYLSQMFNNTCSGNGIRLVCFDSVEIKLAIWLFKICFLNAVYIMPSMIWLPMLAVLPGFYYQSISQNEITFFSRHLKVEYVPIIFFLPSTYW